MKKILDFPDGFFWGAATASFQVEGHIDNTDWSKAGKDGKVPLADSGPDHYNRFESDFDLIKKLDHNCHRFSIEWARIEPEEGKFSKEAVEHYEKVFQALKKRKITPFVTLWHFTLPIWLSEKGGVGNKKFPEYFSRYCQFIVENFKGHCVHWATINEPNVFASNGWVRGVWPPFKKNSFIKIFFILKQLKKAHIEAYKKIKSVDLIAEVGIVKNNMYIHASKNPFHLLTSNIFRWWWNFYFLNQIKYYVDSIGLNYYFHYHFGCRRTVREKSDMGWEIYPEGIYYTLMELKRYEKPIFIAEAGIADEKDQYRSQYIKDLVYWIHRAISDGVDIKGFMYWSLMDNFEWAFGYEKRFGLIEIDYKDKKRKIRPSAYEYKKICQNNALEIKI